MTFKKRPRLEQDGMTLLLIDTDEILVEIEDEDGSLTKILSTDELWSCIKNGAKKYIQDQREKNNESKSS